MRAWRLITRSRKVRSAQGRIVHRHLCNVPRVLRIAAAAALLLLFVAPIANEADIMPVDVLTSAGAAETLGTLSISPGTFEIGVGDEGRLSYTVDGIEGAPGVEWTSSDPAIATVAPGGYVTALSEGTCVVTGVSYGGDVAQAEVGVYPAPEILIVRPSSISLGRGEQYAILPVITARTRASFTYSSSDREVASVDTRGVVSAEKSGTATITVRTHNGLRRTLHVSVSKKPTSIAFRSETILAYVGETVKAPVTLSSGSASVIRYTSSDSEIARVDSSGRVTGISQGEAVIRAGTFNGLTAEASVFVLDPPARIVAPEIFELVAGVPAELDVYAVTEDGAVYKGAMDVDIADPDIVSFVNGVLYPLKRGETYITFTAHRVSLRVGVSVERYGDAYATLVAAHRGGKGNGTENTLPAIVGAVAQGADMIEVDVRKTADDVLVLVHDSTVTRVTDSTGSVARLTLAQLRAMNFGGASICTLEEALRSLSGTGVRLLLEMKASGIEGACVELVRQYEMEDRVTYISFSLTSLAAVRASAPDARIGFLYVSRYDDPAAVASHYGIDVMLPALMLVDEEYVANLHNAGVEVGVWTVNRAADLRRMHRAGVDILITDYVITALKTVGR